jgi:glycogen(starch) synthase
MRDEVVEALGVDPFRIHTVPNGIDPAAWQVDAGRRDTARAERLGSAAAPGPMIVFAGRLVHEKGVQTLIDALALLRDDHPGIRLVVAGTGPYEQRLRGRARSRRVARLVEWAGFVADDELAALLASADVAVVPSHYEPFGIVALEAAACRTPLVVTQTGGLADLIAAGLPSAVAPPEDAAALAKAIGVVLADAPAARRHAARAARTVGRTFSWDAVGTRTAEIYAEVIRAPAGR